MEFSHAQKLPRLLNFILPTGRGLIDRHNKRLKFQGRCHFHNCGIRLAVKPFLLADIGEGITECQIITWSVKPGDRVAQFEPLCEVQSDKASVEITSRFDGTIKRLHYAVDDMAIVGKPLLDIDVDSETSEEMEALEEPVAQIAAQIQLDEAENALKNDTQRTAGPQEPQVFEESDEVLKTPKYLPTHGNSHSNKKNAGLATPGIRHMLKELKLDLADIQGTGKGGRVAKEDIQQHLAQCNTTSNQSGTQKPITKPMLEFNAISEDKIVSLTPIESQMFKVMSRSLSIPHFLYTHAVDCTALSSLRGRFNTSDTLISALSMPGPSEVKLTPLPIIMKAVSYAFGQFPKLNSHLDTETDSKRPRLLIKASHNFGIAVDTSQGLLVPVVRDVQNHSISSLAAEILRLSKLAKEGALAPQDFQGATFSISNIGSIGGFAVSPVIVAPMVGILGIGKINKVLKMQKEDDGSSRVVEREQLVLSWSADHRILDGAMVAKCAEMVGKLLQNADALGLVLR